jgi:glycine/D-amino acid oxidase-like deaminating enzyme
MNNQIKEQLFDVIVIGGGPIGLSTAYHISKQDTTKRILLVEQFKFVNEEVSSSGKSRQFRVQYDTVPMARLALRAKDQWLAFNDASQQELLEQVGALWFGDPDLNSSEGGINDAIKVMNELGIPYDPLSSGEQIMERFNFKDLPSDYEGFFQADGGILDIAATQEFILAELRKNNNVVLKDFTEVTDIESLPNDDIIVTAKSTQKSGEITRYKAEKLALTPGPYVNDLVSHFGLKVGIDIWTMSSSYYKILDPAIAEIGTTYYVYENNETGLFYGFNEVPWANPGYVRVANAVADEIVDHPSESSHEPDLKNIAYTTDWVKNHMPGLEPVASHLSTCMVAISQSDNEILLDYLPNTISNNKNIVVYTAGWAAKFIPTLGDLISKMLLDTVSDEDRYFLDYMTIDWEFPFDTYARHLHKKEEKKEDGKQGEKQLLRSSAPKKTKQLPKGHKKFTSTPEPELDLDVAIVGAGASGLYSGYRLRTGVDSNGNPLNLKVNLFEASDRICGRLDSVELPGMEVTAELGGMRYMNTQKIITGLINKYQTDGLLKSIPFEMGDSGNQLIYLRKQRYHAEDYKLPDFKTRYNVDQKYEGKSANFVFNDIIDSVLQADGESIAGIQGSKDPQAEWRRVKRDLIYNFNGPYYKKNVYEIGFWNLLKDRSSQECYEFLANAGGYYSNTINWNAAEAFPYMVGDFSDDNVTYNTIEGGFDKVLRVTASNFVNAGGTIKPNNVLVNFEKTTTDDPTNRKYKLIFENVETGEKHNYQVRNTAKQWVAYADDIILGMPRRSLELLDQSNFLFNPFESESKALHHNVKSVMNEPALKILLGFEKPWWPIDPSEYQSPSVTDLPMRQCYYFGTDANNHSLFLASYNDMRTVSFWKAMENDELFETKTTDYLSATATRRKRFQEYLEKDVPPATKSMVAEVMKEVKEMHGRDDIPEPYTSAYKDWSQDPYGGGYHAWKSGFVVADKMPEIRQPQGNERVFIVGEAYSDQQGWVEGAFCEAEKVMLHRYNLERPKWIPTDYFLGWK